VFTVKNYILPNSEINPYEGVEGYEKNISAK
jgi:hypothetical protein